MPTEEVSQDNPFAYLKELGPYRIIELLGHGGMGYVFRAEDSRSGETVAVKVMAPDFSLDESMVKRFQREADILKAIRHSGIVRVLDVDMEGKPRYYAMDFIHGHTLSQELKNGQLSLEEVIGIAWQVAEALNAAHEAGVVHRDIKPANILRDDSGAIKLTDFGIARVIGTESGTKAGKFLGTPAYMSPEQVLGKDLGTASDIYSFGVVLYEMLTGRLPFESENPLDVMRKHVYEEPKLPKELNPKVPVILSELVMKMLKKKRDERISSARIFESELQKCVRTMQGDLDTVTSELTLEEEAKRETRGRLVKFVLGLIFIAMVVSLAAKFGGGWRGFAKRYLVPATDELSLKETVSGIKNPYLRAKASLRFVEKGDLEVFDRMLLDFSILSVSEKRELLSIIGERKIPLTLLLVRGAQAEEDLRAAANEALINFGNVFLTSLIEGDLDWFDKLEISSWLDRRWALPIIEAGLKSKDPAVHLMGVFLLEEKGEDVGNRIGGVVESFADLLKRGGEAENVRLLKQLSEVSSTWIRELRKDAVSGKYKAGEKEMLLVARALAVSGDKSGVEMLRRNLVNPDPYQRILAYQGTIALEGKPVLEQMKLELGSDEPLVRALFAAELLAQGEEEGKVVLKEARWSPDWRVRQVAVEALARNGDGQVLELLSEVLKYKKDTTEDYSARVQAAIDTLDRLNEGLMLMKFCNSCDDEFAVQCIRSLARLAPEDSAEVFIDVISGSDEDIMHERKLWAQGGLLHNISKWLEEYG